MGRNACSEPISGLGGHTLRTSHVRIGRTRLPSGGGGGGTSHPYPMELGQPRHVPPGDGRTGAVLPTGERNPTRAVADTSRTLDALS